MFTRPPSGAGNTIPRRCGSRSSAPTTRARSGTARREPVVLPYSFGRPFAKARRTMSMRRSRSTSRHSAPKPSSGRTPVPARKVTRAPEMTSSSSAIASSSSQDSKGWISPGRGSGFLTCTAGLSSIHLQRTAACSTCRSARCERYRLPSGTAARQVATRSTVSAAIGEEQRSRPARLLLVRSRRLRLDQRHAACHAEGRPQSASSRGAARVALRVRAMRSA